MKGWKGKILRVNLSEKTISIEDLNSDVAKKYIGGRGLASKYLFDEIDPVIDPLGYENKLIFATGPATGTSAFGGARFMVVTKGPLTDVIACANSGGYWGYELKRAGYDMVIIEGKSDKPVYLWINSRVVEIRPAIDLWGKYVSDTQKIIQAQTDKRARIACIGPAGENLVKLACIINDEGRAAGRSGAGAVMGSKKLKAIAVRGTESIHVCNEHEIKDLYQKAWKKISKPQPLSDGTASYIEFICAAGILPEKNFQTVATSVDGIDFKNQKRYFIRSSPCYKCPIGCGRISEIEISEEKRVGPGPEYEGLFAFGTCCGIRNLKAIIEAFFLCNELGLDVISAGVTIACAMELYEKGFIKNKMIRLRFGDSDKMLEMLYKLGHRHEIGDVLAEGSYRLSECFGNTEYSMSTKKQEFPGYDPRACQGFGLAYATSNCGASHMRAEPALAELWGFPIKLDPFVTDGKAQYVIDLQNEVSAHDSMGICQFLSGYKLGLDTIVNALEAITGAGFNREAFMKTGERIWNLERLFNIRTGITSDEDTLPKRMLEEPLPVGPAKGQIVKLDKMLFEYYLLRGWDNTGNIPVAKLKELDIM